VPQSFAEAQEILAARLPGYTPRPEQEQLAAAIEEAIVTNRILLAQAGTGVGKSLGAMIPAILHAIRTSQRVIVAPTTKALQRQYQEKDLPWLEENLGVPFTWAVLKGRGNYLCLNKAEQLRDASETQQAALEAAKGEFDADGARTGEEPTGDREDLPVMDDRDWSRISTSAAECPGKSECPFGHLCFAEKARDRALAADVTITNTAYLMQDRKLRLVARTEDGEPVIRLLGDYGLVIMDEAHNLPDIATEALSDQVGENALKKLARDAARLLTQFGSESDDAVLDEMSVLWQGLRQAFDFYARTADGKPGDPALLSQLGAWLPFVREAILSVAGTLTGLEARVRRARRQMSEQADKARAISVLKRIDDWKGKLAALASDDPSYIRWLEEDQQRVHGQLERRLYLRSKPLSPARFLHTLWEDEIPVVMMSATLAVGQDWDYLERWIGLGGEARRQRFDAGSPFDYQRQARLFVPDKTVPAPSGHTRPAWSAWAQEVTAHLVTASGGGALLLYTSRSEMERSWEVLAPRFRKAGLTCMKQGDAAPGEMKAVFAADGNAVLWGLKTYMEGIDIQGRALRLVVLDKLPFAVPSDLLFQARSELLDRTIRPYAGFDKLSIPMMSLTLIQAFGRLIRHRDDKGVVAVLDSRLTAKRYGSRILATLPPAPCTSDLAKVAAFLEEAS
jgi:ATP-dependent DNA helicase DinG